jgi:hypothetical protein
MPFSIHAMAVDTFVPMLRSLSKVLGKGAEHANARKFDPAVLVNARLAPDMYPLAMQIKFACDNAADATARLAGQEPPASGGPEPTLDGLVTRIARTIESLQKAPAAAFEGAEERGIRLPLRGDLVFEAKGYEYLRDWAFPHFYFHVVTAYNILRHNGVDIGKRDYMGGAGTHIRWPGRQGS